MQADKIPAKFPVPFASGAGPSYARQIPQVSSGVPGSANLVEGFPPLNFIPVSAGGIAPSGLDFNGVLNQISAWAQWQSAGGAIAYDAAFQTAIGGYPMGAVVGSVTTPGLTYRSLVDNNATNPDAAGAGWTTSGRQVVTADVVLHVSPSGSDATGNGSLAAPFATPQAAYGYACKNLDFSFKHGLAISVAAGTYSSQQVFGAMPVGLAAFALTGAGATASAVKFVNSSGGAAAYALVFTGNAVCSLSNVYVAATGGAGSDYVTASSALVASNATVYLDNIVFGPTTCYHLWATGANSVITTLGNPYTIAGGAGLAHAFAALGGSVTFVDSPVLLVGTSGAPLAFGSFATATQGGVVQAWSAVFKNIPSLINGVPNGTPAPGYTDGSGNSVVSGQRYACSAFGAVVVNGAGQNFLPGTAAGIGGSISNGFGGFYG